jgi:hypothetical protein
MVRFARKVMMRRTAISESMRLRGVETTPGEAVAGKKRLLPQGIGERSPR